MMAQQFCIVKGLLVLWESAVSQVDGREDKARAVTTDVPPVVLGTWLDKRKVASQDALAAGLPQVWNHVVES